MPTLVVARFSHCSGRCELRAPFTLLSKNQRTILLATQRVNLLLNRGHRNHAASPWFLMAISFSKCSWPRWMLYFCCDGYGNTLKLIRGDAHAGFPRHPHKHHLQILVTAEKSVGCDSQKRRMLRWDPGYAEPSSARSFHMMIAEMRMAVVALVGGYCCRRYHVSTQDFRVYRAFRLTDFSQVRCLASITQRQVCLFRKSCGQLLSIETLCARRSFLRSTSFDENNAGGLMDIGVLLQKDRVCPSVFFKSDAVLWGSKNGACFSGLVLQKSLPRRSFAQLRLSEIRALGLYRAAGFRVP